MENFVKRFKKLIYWTSLLPLATFMLPFIWIFNLGWYGVVIQVILLSIQILAAVIAFKYRRIVF